MNIKRAILTGVYTYIISFVIFGLLSFFVKDNVMLLYILNWIVTVPLVLLLAKWYFRKGKITTKTGFLLGLIIIGVGLSFDATFYILTILMQQSTEIFDNMYKDWKFYLSVAEVVALTTYAGFEFDATYTKY